MSAVARYLMENIPLTKQATKKKLRQFLSIALAFTTTVSLSGFALLFAVTASAAVTPLSDGDLVRGPDGIKVYIVKPAPHGTYAGWKRHIFNPAVFNMYGHLKWENIQSVNQETVDAYQTSDLYKELVDPRVYSLEESGSSAVKRWIENEAAFLANGYSWSQIFTVNEAERDYYVSGSPITTTVTPPTTPPVTPATGTGLTVSLASNTAAAGSIVADSLSTDGAQAMASMLTANFAAGSDGDVAVTTLKVTRKGISADADLANAYLYDGETRVAEMLNIGSNVITFSNTAGLFMVSRGTSKAITVKIDVTNGTTAGKTIVLAINAASDVVAGSATIAGSYPITGNYMTTAAVSDLGKVTIANVSPTGATTVDPGQTGYEVWRLSVAATDQKVKVSKIKVTNIGSVATTDLTNIKLMDAATQLGSTAASLGIDGSVTFDMSANPLVVIAGQTKNLSVMADIVGGTTRTFRFTIQRSADIVAMDDNYGIYLKPNQTDSFVVVTANSATTATTINSGTLTVSVDPASPNGNVAKDYTDQEFARFQFKASGEAVKVTSLTATGTITSNTGLNNAKLYLDGTQVGSTADLATSTNSATFNFGNSFIIPAGATKTVIIKGEVKKSDATSFTDGNTIQVSLVAGSSNAQGQTSLSNISTSAANGNVLTVRTGTLTLGVNSGLANAAVGTPTGVKGAVGTKIASFTLTAGSGEAVTVTQIVVKNNATTGQGLGSDFQNLTLKNGSTQLGTQIGSLSTTAANTYTFTPSPSISVAAGQQYVVDVYADSLTGATNTAVAYSAVTLDSVTATGQSTNSTAGDGTDQIGQNIYIATSGSLTLAAASDMPIAQLRSMGQTGQTLATFKLTAGPQESINVTKVIVTDTISGTSAAATGSITNLKLFKSNGTQVGTTVTSMSSSSTGLNVLATFNGISNLTVAKDGTEILTLKGDVNGYPNAVSGSAHTFQIISAGDVTALGALSGQGPSVSGAPAGTAQTVYRSELSVANAMSNMTGGASAAQQVGKYTFTNTSAGNYTITVTDLDLNISSTLSAGTGTVVIKKDSPSGTTLATKTFTTASLANVTAWDAAFTSFTIDAANGTGSVDLYVLVDTASFTPAAAKTISTSIGATGVVWGEVISTGIANIDGAPIYGATITY